MNPSQEEMADQLRSALSAGSISPHFQPIVCLNDGNIVGLEVLARWTHERFGDVSPAIFIPLIEGQGLLDPLFDALLAKALSAAKAWPNHLFLAFNVSPDQTHRADLPSRVAAAAAAAEFPASRIHIEITETATFRDMTHAKTVLDALVAMGCRVVIDDFGTGHASLTWLLNLPVDTIKVDQVFVKSMLCRKESRKIITAVMGLGRSLGLPIVAEGVETEEQAGFLRRLGCEMAQGYFFGRPVAADAVPGELASFPKPVPGTARHQMSLEQRAYQIASLYRWDDLMIGFTDAKGTLVDASDSFARRFGLRPSEAIGRSLGALSREGSDPSGLPTFEDAALGGRRVIETTLPNGRTDVLTLHRVEDEFGEVLGYSVVGIDVTELRQAQHILRERQEQFDFIVQNCPHIFWSMKPDGKLAFVHPRWSEISGMSHDKIGTSAVYDFIDPAHGQHVAARWKTCLETGEVFDMYYRHLIADGQWHWVRCWGAPHRDPSGAILSWYGTLSVIDPPLPPDGSPGLSFSQIA